MDQSNAMGFVTAIGAISEALGILRENCIPERLYQARSCSPMPNVSYGYIAIRK